MQIQYVRRVRSRHRQIANSAIASQNRDDEQVVTRTNDAARAVDRTDRLSADQSNPIVLARTGIRNSARLIAAVMMRARSSAQLLRQLDRRFDRLWLEESDFHAFTISLISGLAPFELERADDADEEAGEDRLQARGRERGPGDQPAQRDLRIEHAEISQPPVVDDRRDQPAADRNRSARPRSNRARASR